MENKKEKTSKLNNIKLTNSIALGILSKLLGSFPIENIKKAYEKILSNKTDLIQKNIEAFMLGFNYINEESNDGRN